MWLLDKSFADKKTTGRRGFAPKAAYLDSGVLLSKQGIIMLMMTRLYGQTYFVLACWKHTHTRSHDYLFIHAFLNFSVPKCLLSLDLT